MYRDGHYPRHAYREHVETVDIVEGKKEKRKRIINYKTFSYLIVALPFGSATKKINELKLHCQLVCDSLSSQYWMTERVKEMGDEF